MNSFVIIITVLIILIVAVLWILAGYTPVIPPLAPVNNYN